MTSCLRNCRSTATLGEALGQGVASLRAARGGGRVGCCIHAGSLSSLIVCLDMSMVASADGPQLCDNIDRDIQSNALPVKMGHYRARYRMTVRRMAERMLVVDIVDYIWHAQGGGALLACARRWSASGRSTRPH